MKVINAKELRLKLDEILDTVLSGEDVIVKHRFKKPVRISGADPKTNNKRSLRGLATFDKANKEVSPYDENISMKKLYKQELNIKYG